MPAEPPEDDDALSDEELDALEEAEDAGRLTALARGVRVARLTDGPASTPRPVGPREWPSPAVQLPGFPEDPPGWAPPDTAQGRVLAAWVDCVQELVAARLGAGLSVRAWAQAAGVPTSSAVTLTSGSAWPTWRTLGLLCQPVGLRPVLVQVVGRERALSRVGSRVKGPDRDAVEAAARASGDPEAVAAAWHNLAVEQLRWLVRASGTRSGDVAAAIGARPATWSEARPFAPGRWTSLQVTLAVGDLMGQRLRLMDASRVWPSPPWAHSQG